MTEVHTVSQACHLDLAKVQCGCHDDTERALGNVISTVGHATPRGPCHGKGKRSTSSHLIWCITARRTLPCLIRTHIIQSNYKVTTIHARMCEHFFSRLLHRCIFNSVCVVVVVDDFKVFHSLLLLLLWLVHSSNDSSKGPVYISIPTITLFIHVYSSF